MDYPNNYSYSFQRKTFSDKAAYYFGEDHAWIWVPHFTTESCNKVGKERLTRYLQRLIRKRYSDWKHRRIRSGVWRVWCIELYEKGSKVIDLGEVDA